MDTPKKNSFWNRPEGTTGKAILWGLGIGAAALLWKFSGAIISLLVNVYIIGGLLLGLYILYLVVSSERFSTLLFYMLQSISRAITSMWVEFDPVAILESFIKDMKDKLETVDTAITKMMTVRQKAAKERETADREMRDFINKANVADQAGNMEAERDVLAAKAGRRKKMIEDADSNLKYTSDAIATLQRVRNLVVYHIENSEDEAKYLKSSNEQALAMIAATAAASEALGDTDKLDVKNMARDVILDRTATARGQVESLMEFTRNMSTDMNLTDLTYKSDGAKMLADLQKSLNTAEKGTPQKAIGAGAAQPLKVVQGSKWESRLKK